MLGDEHAADSGDEHNGTEQDGGFMGIENFALADQTVHDKDTVIDADAENERGDDDADEVELYIEEHHHAQHDEPAE